nr:reverse transcriptase domain-containing protein [Tanacetum cinerariifolium]
SFKEKTDLINVLKTRKKAIAWKLTDIRGIDPEFCSHKILLEEEYSSKVQSQRRVNPKIHDVIKKEVEKLLDAGLIYPISDSPWAGEFILTIGNSTKLHGPLSIWKKLSLPELTPTRMTLELADSRSKSTFKFKEVLLENRSCFNRCIWRGNYPQVNRVDVIDVTCEDFVQDVLDFKYNPKSSNPTLVSDDSISENDSCKVPIVKSSSLTLTPFGESDFILEETEDFLNDDSIPDEIDDFIISKNLKVNEREALLNVLKSHKRAIAWKISDTKGIEL